MSRAEGETRPVIFTIGHGARTIEGFIELLSGAGVELLVDVRTAPGSRKHPQFGKDALQESLRAAGIAYRWERRLGGFRRADPGSRHTALRTAGFRGYADHMETGDFAAARDALIESSREGSTAVMCAESLWWRCHRRMLSDALAVAGCEVRHIMEGGRQDPHRLSPAARVQGGTLIYDVAEEEDAQQTLPTEE